MTEQDLQYIEKVRVPEWEAYGWATACKAIKQLIGEIRKLKKTRVVK